MGKKKNNKNKFVFDVENKVNLDVEDKPEGLHNFRDFVEEAKRQDESEGINTEPYHLVIPKEYSNTGKDEEFFIPVPDADKVMAFTSIDANNITEWFSVIFSDSVDDYQRFLYALKGVSPQVLGLFLASFLEWWQPKATNLPSSFPKLKG